MDVEVILLGRLYVTMHRKRDDYETNAFLVGSDGFEPVAVVLLD